MPAVESLVTFNLLSKLEIERDSQDLLKSEYSSKFPNLCTLIINGYKNLVNSTTHQIPPSVSTLIFGFLFNQELPTIPITVLNLQIGKTFNKNIDFSQLLHLQSLKIITKRIPLTSNDFKLFKSLKKLSFQTIESLDVCQKNIDFPNFESCDIYYNSRYVRNKERKKTGNKFF